MKKGLLWISLIVLMAVALIGCSDDSAEGEASSGAKGDDVTVTLYTSESQDLVGEMMKDFEAENPGIKVEIYRSGTEKVIAKLEAEKSSGGIQADMIWFADIDYFNRMDDEGMLEQYQPDAENIDDKFIYKDGKYFEVRQIYNILAANAGTDHEITSWKDLSDPALSGKIAMANPHYSGAAFLTLATVVSNDDLGWDYFQSLKDNNLKFEESNGNLSSKVSTGEYHAVSVVDFMALNAKNEGSPVEPIWPEEGAVIIPTPVGIMSDSDVKDASKKVIDYLLSEEGQTTFKEQGYIPVNKEVGVPEGAPDVDDIKVMPLDYDFLKENREELKSKFSEIFDVK